MKRVVIIGECMVEFSPLGDKTYKRGFAGDTFNTAWYLRQFLDGNWSVRYVTNIGDDQLSGDMMHFITESKIDTSYIKVVAGMTAGLYVISLENGERSFSYWRSASPARLLADDVDWLRAATRGADCIFFSGITLAILSDIARGVLLQHLLERRLEGVQIVFDPNIRKRLWQSDDDIRHWITWAYGVANVALPSFADEAEIFGDIDMSQTATRIREAGVEEVIVKNGGDACLLQIVDYAETIKPEYIAKAVDTTGAGDSFNASYLASRLSGSDTRVAVEKAHKVAANVIRAHGALVHL